MTKFLLIAILVLVVAVFVLFLLWRAALKKQKETKASLEQTKKQLNEAIVQQAKLESTISILQKNRYEADEKVNGLHNGDSLGNALDELRKPKS